MRKFLFSLPLLLCAPVFAGEEIDGDRSDLLLKLIRDNGCKMTNAEAGEILPGHGFTKDETRDIVRSWEDAGWLDAKGSLGLALTEAACADG